MRISSSLSGIDLSAQNNLLRAFNQLNQSNTRLATMKRVNSGRDDPAGLIAIGQIQAELTAIGEASDNASRAVGLIRTADSGLGQVSSLLNDVRGAIVSVAGGGLSKAEVAAKQLEIDAAMEAIDRIGNTTSFAGRNLLDGQGSGDAMTFSFSLDVSQTASVAMPTINAAALGNGNGRLSDLTSGGKFDLSSGNLGQAMEVIDAASMDVLRGRAQAGAFEKYTIESSQEMLGSMEVNISSALSTILDTDVATETSRLVRSQLL